MTIYNINQGNTILIFDGMENSLEIKAGTLNFAAWNSWLSSFKEQYKNSENHPYSKNNNLSAQPKAFNNVVMKVEELND